MKGFIDFYGKAIEVVYYFIDEDTIEFSYEGNKYITHYKSLIM